MGKSFSAIIVVLIVVCIFAIPAVVVLHNRQSHDYSFKKFETGCDTYTLPRGERVVRIEPNTVVTVEDTGTGPNGVTLPHVYHHRSLNRNWCDTIVEQ